MRIAVLGTGMVGRALAGRWDELGHEVTLGTRDPERTREALAEGGPLADSALPHLLIWPLYYIGQLLICLGALRLLRAESRAA